MPRRNIIFANSEVYHVYNRSVANQEIFLNNTDLTRTLTLIDYYCYPQTLSYSKFKNFSREAKKNYSVLYKSRQRIVNLYAYALMPDHFHLLLEQVHSKGVVNLISKFQNSYAKYFNTKRNRNGSVFQNPFKAKRIDKDEYLLHVSRYIHLNPVTSYLIEVDELENTPGTRSEIMQTKRKRGLLIHYF